MKEILISEFCQQESQLRAAQIMGCTQSAVSQMVRSGRQIYFSKSESGDWEYREIKTPGRKKAA